MKIDKKTIALLALILLHIFLASWYILHGTINFNTDIARDFLLLEDIVENKNITLIGPRSGGISGVFHGPLWIYLLVPAYIIGQGNPVVVGIFWVLLFIVSIGFVYYVGKKLFDHWTGLLAAVLYSSVLASSVHAMFNPFGAVLLFPLFFYFFYRYTEKLQAKDLAISIFILGTIVQFQMAFGMPIFILILPYIFYLIFKNKQYSHIFILFLILLPLSSFILFDLRHDFLQVKSVIAYLSSPRSIERESISLPLFLLTRISYMINASFGMIASSKWIFTVVLLIPFILSLKKIERKQRRKYILFFYLFIGYWLLTLAYRDEVQVYYHWPFITIVAILFASLWKKIDTRLFFIIFISIYINNLVTTYKLTANNPLAETDDSHWKFFKNAAEIVYNDAPNEFGFYVYTNDRFAYSGRYAMNYMQRKYPEKKASSFQKKQTTYLLMSDSGTNKYTNRNDWKKYDLFMTRPAVQSWKKNEFFTIEKHQLTTEEIATGSNPNLIQDLTFR